MIFISYSSDNEESAIGLYDALRVAGYTCHDIFLDRDQRSRIELGADWEKVLRENASQCRALLTLVSPGWLESRHKPIIRLFISSVGCSLIDDVVSRNGVPMLVKLQIRLALKDHCS